MPANDHEIEAGVETAGIEPARRSPRRFDAFAGVFALLVLLLATSATASAATPRQILSDLAANHTHSWIDNPLGYGALTARYKAGERINSTCGFVSEVARRLLVEAGYTARVVQTITREPFDGLNDGHAMVEVFAAGRWRLYDVDGNVRAIDNAGRGISLVEQITAVREQRATWEQIASDPLFREDEPNELLRELARSVFADPAAFYERALGTAFLPRDAEGTGNNGLYYIDDDQTERLRAAGYLTGRYLTTPAIWFNLTGVVQPNAGTMTTELALAPAPPAASAPSPVPGSLVTAPACKRCATRWLGVRSRARYKSVKSTRKPRLRPSGNRDRR